MKNTLFELNNLIVDLENNNKFSEANSLNLEFIKIAQQIREEQESSELKFRVDLTSRMISEFILALDDISGAMIRAARNPSLGMLKSLGMAVKQIASASKSLNNKAFINNIAKGMMSIPKSMLANKSFLGKMKFGVGIIFQFFQLYSLVMQISALVKKTSPEILNDANERSIYFGEIIGMLSNLVSIGASVMGPAAPGLHALALSLQGTGLLLEYAPQAAEKLSNYLENVTPEDKENVALGEQGIPSCNRMTLQWAKSKVKSYQGNVLDLFMDLLENHLSEITKPGPHTALISSIVKNPKYSNIHQQYMTEMFAIIKCGYGIESL